MLLVRRRPDLTGPLAEAIATFGPVMGQLFGQSEAPMMISTMAPAEHVNPEGTPNLPRLASAGRPAPSVTVAILGADGRRRPAGERGEIVVRSSLVMPGYYNNPVATARDSEPAATACRINGWRLDEPRDEGEPASA